MLSACFESSQPNAVYFGRLAFWFIARECQRYRLAALGPGAAQCLRILGNGPFPISIHAGNIEREVSMLKLKAGARKSVRVLIRAVQCTLNAAQGGTFQLKLLVQRTECSRVVPGLV